MTLPNMQLTVLHCGECEPLKATVHGSALALSVLMGLYNAAAWLKRRDGHLAVNAIFYLGLVAWEQKHFAHHLRALKRVREAAAQPDIPNAVAAETRIAA
jgi:hypothetical protein